eukprot:5618001-Prymnesium_polylepis.1
MYGDGSRSRRGPPPRSLRSRAIGSRLWAVRAGQSGAGATEWSWLGSPSSSAARCCPADAQMTGHPRETPKPR